LALVLSFIIPGVGQIYCGRIARGVVILILAPVLSIVLSILMYGVVLWGSGTIESMNAAFPLLVIILVIALIIFWVWQIVDAYRLANRYNEELRRTGRAPW